jgi:hypothetical protein
LITQFVALFEALEPDFDETRTSFPDFSELAE